MSTIYKNAKVFGTLTDIEVKGGKFYTIGKCAEDGIDLHGNKVYPGLVDIHTHGCIGYDTMDAVYLNEMSCHQAKSGVTSWYPTTMTMPFDSLKRVTDIDITQIKGANVLGFHMEGPYISPKYKGAQNEDYIKKPDIEEFSKYKNAKLVTIAPEIEGSMEFIKNCDAVVCIGHTDADYDTAIEAIENGAICLTHTFNAMPPLNHRQPSVIGAAIKKNIYVQLICDGLHIHESVVTALYRIFGPDRVVLISDSLSATGMNDGEYELGGQKVTVKNRVARVPSGAIAGSTSTLMDCVKKAIEFNIPEEDAFKMASATPSELMGINKGKIKVGYDADFIVIDDNYNVIKTVIGGKEFN